jgi:hypothetical protein
MTRYARALDARPPAQLPLWPDPTDRGWRVRVSLRARRMSIRIHAGGRVEIVVPSWARARAIEGFVHRHRRWVERKIDELSARAPGLHEPVPSTIVLAASGERFQVETTSGQGCVRLGEPEPGRIVLSGDRAQVGQIQATLLEWLIERARLTLVPRLDTLAAETGLEFQRVQIRRQRSRWGSCSVRGTVSLNCCLVFQRTEVVRYLLLHELCHTRHMNHSRRFWQLVARFEPNHRALDRELLGGWQNVPAWVFGT